VAIPSWAIDLRYRRIFVSLTHLRHNHVSRNSDFPCHHLQTTSDAKLNLMLGSANLSGVLVIGFDANIDMFPQLLDGVERGGNSFAGCRTRSQCGRARKPTSTQSRIEQFDALRASRRNLTDEACATARVRSSLVRPRTRERCHEDPQPISCMTRVCGPRVQWLKISDPVYSQKRPA
jgi:hypothetical protein